MNLWEIVFSFNSGYYLDVFVHSRGNGLIGKALDGFLAQYNNINPRFKRKNSQSKIFKFC